MSQVVGGVKLWLSLEVLEVVVGESDSFENAPVGEVLLLFESSGVWYGVLDRLSIGRWWWWWW